MLYIGALAAPNTVNTMPEETLLAFADHGQVDRAMPRDGGDAEQVLVEHHPGRRRCRRAGQATAGRGRQGFVDSWKDLLGAIETKSKALA